MPVNGLFLPLKLNPINISLYQQIDGGEAIPSGPLYVTDNEIYLSTDSGQYLAPDE